MGPECHMAMCVQMQMQADVWTGVWRPTSGNVIFSCDSRKCLNRVNNIVCLGKGNKSCFLSQRAMLRSNTNWCPTNVMQEKQQYLKWMGEDPDMSVTCSGHTEHQSCSLFPALALAWYPLIPYASTQLQAAATFFQLQCHWGSCLPSCGEGQALYCYRVSVYAIWPIKLSIRSLQNPIICKYNYIHKSISFAPCVLICTTEATEMASKSALG